MLIRIIFPANPQNYIDCMTAQAYYLATMNRLSTAERAQIVRCLCEGMSIRGTVRVTGVAKNTIVKLLGEIGDACADLHDRTVRGLHVERLQCDEIWSFVGAKQRNASPEQKADGWGRCVDVDSNRCRHEALCDIPCWRSYNRLGRRFYERLPCADQEQSANHDGRT